MHNSSHAWSHKLLNRIVHNLGQQRSSSLQSKTNTKSVHSRCRYTNSAGGHTKHTNLDLCQPCIDQGKPPQVKTHLGNPCSGKNPTQHNTFNKKTLTQQQYCWEQAHMQEKSLNSCMPDDRLITDPWKEGFQIGWRYKCIQYCMSCDREMTGACTSKEKIEMYARTMCTTWKYFNCSDYQLL